MTQLKKRATALLLGSVTFFIALAMPYNTTRVYAADVAFSWVVNESSNTILNWILLYLGISVAPEAISEGKVFDKTGQFAMDFCQEFFGDTFEQWYVSNGFSEDIDMFKREFNDILTQDFDAAKYVAGDIKSSVLEILYKYLHSSSNVYDLNSLSGINDVVSGSINAVGQTKVIDSKGVEYSLCHESTKIDIISGSPKVIDVIWQYADNRVYEMCFLYSSSDFKIKRYDGFESRTFLEHGIYIVNLFSGSLNSINNGISKYMDLSSFPRIFIKNDLTFPGQQPYESIYEYVARSIEHVVIPNIDIPDVAGKDYAYDLVGWPDAWDVDKPDVKPWDDVDSLPIPGDIAIPKEIPGVTDLPGIMDGVIGGTIPWPDIIDIIKDLPVDPTPDPDKPTEPDPDPELPEIPAVLPQGVSDKLKDLSGKFPFCIPFDLVDCFKSFGSNEAAEAPKWDFTFKIPGTNKDYEFSVDLSMFDKYIPIFRSGVLILFLIGLIIGTRKLIGWQVKN